MNRMIGMLGLVTMAALAAGCGETAKVGDASERETLRADARQAMADFNRTDASLDGVLSRSYGYAIFPQITSAAVGVGGAHGDGVVYERGQMVGYADVSQANIGVQLGAQKYAELVIFQNEASMQDFKKGHVEFDAKATAVAASSGAGANADYSRGVLVFALPEGGLMAQAAVGGQKFRFTPANMSSERYETRTSMP